MGDGVHGGLLLLSGTPHSQHRGYIVERGRNCRRRLDAEDFQLPAPDGRNPTLLSIAAHGSRVPTLLTEIGDNGYLAVAEVSFRC